MRPSKLLPFTQWADISRTNKFVCAEPMSGYRMIQPDDNNHVTYLPPDATDEALGRALLEALGKSRFIWPPDEPEFFKWERYMARRREREEDFIRRYHYKTRRELYKTMNWCRAKRSEGTISIVPHDRDAKPGNWKWLAPDMTVVIPATTVAIEAGAALKLALDRCA